MFSFRGTRLVTIFTRNKQTLVFNLMTAWIFTICRMS